MTKEEKRDAALKAYKAIDEPAYEAYEAIQEPAWEAYKAIKNPAYKVYQSIRELALKDYRADLRIIDSEPDEDIIERDGKRYQLIK